MIAHMFDCVNMDFTWRKEQVLGVGGQRGPYPAEGTGPVGVAEVVQHPVGVVCQAGGLAAVDEVARQRAAGSFAAEQRGGDPLAGVRIAEAGRVTAAENACRMMPTLALAAPRGLACATQPAVQ